MAEPLKKEKQETETIEEWYSEVYGYDPTPEDLKKLYGEEFNKWCDDLLKDV